MVNPFKNCPRELRLNNRDETPYIKKRIGGRGGFRFYYLLIIKDESLLNVCHPKSGSLGADNITDASKAHLYKKILECIKTKDIYILSLNPERERIIFKKV